MLTMLNARTSHPSSSQPGLPADIDPAKANIVQVTAIIARRKNENDNAVELTRLLLKFLRHHPSELVRVEEVAQQHLKGGQMGKALVDQLRQIRQGKLQIDDLTFRWGIQEPGEFIRPRFSRW